MGADHGIRNGGHRLKKQDTTLSATLTIGEVVKGI